MDRRLGRAPLLPWTSSLPGVKTQFLGLLSSNLHRLGFEKNRMKEIKVQINEERNKGGYEDRESGRKSG
jgi:hypothetical protein